MQRSASVLSLATSFRSCGGCLTASFLRRAYGTMENQPTAISHIDGDLNNTSAARTYVETAPDWEYLHRTLAIPAAKDDAEIRRQYRPFLLGGKIASSDWIAQLEMTTAMELAEEDTKKTGQRLRVLVLYGSMRERLVLIPNRIVFKNIPNISQIVFSPPRPRSRPHPLPSRLRCPSLQPRRPTHERRHPAQPQQGARAAPA